MPVGDFEQYLIDSLAERSCLQTDLRSEIGNCATEIRIEPFDSLREYRQLCFGAFRYEIMGGSVSVRRTIIR